jgi:hypothetical protein
VRKKPVNSMTQKKVSNEFNLPTPKTQKVELPSQLKEFGLTTPESQKVELPSRWWTDKRQRVVAASVVCWQEGPTPQWWVNVSRALWEKALGKSPPKSTPSFKNGAFLAFNYALGRFLGHPKAELPEDDPAISETVGLLYDNESLKDVEDHMAGFAFALNRARSSHEAGGKTYRIYMTLWANPGPIEKLRGRPSAHKEIREFLEKLGCTFASQNGAKRFFNRVGLTARLPKPTP